MPIILDSYLTQVLYASAIGIVYAFAGMFQALSTGESFDGASFLKTVLLSLVSAGLISTQTADLATTLGAQAGVVLFLDKIINAIRKSNAVKPVVATTAIPPK